MLTNYIPFSITLHDGKILPIRNIFAFRNIFATQFKDKQYIMRYSIKSGDTPTSLAYYLYASERYEWIIYCMNTITNPYYDWPLSEEDFYEMIESKYLGKKCLFLDMNTFTTNFVVGETITSGSTAGSVTAVVDAWDRTLQKLTIKDQAGVGSFSVGDEITSDSANGIIGRIVDRAESAVHHFETAGGLFLDPLIGYLQSYLASNETNVITNMQYEDQLNDSKREIYVLRSEFVRTAENILIGNINKLSEFDAENILL
jgi:hypothetical protein